MYGQVILMQSMIPVLDKGVMTCTVVHARMVHQLGGQHATLTCPNSHSHLSV